MTERNTEGEEETRTVLRLHWARNEETITQAAKLDGKYLLATNRWTMSMLDMLTTYKRRDRVEKAFMITKSVLRMRPMFLRTDTRIEMLAFCAMMALLVYSILGEQVRKTEMGLSVKVVLKAFDNVTVSELIFQDGSQLYQCSYLDPAQAWILDRLGYPDPSVYLDAIA